MHKKFFRVTIYSWILFSLFSCNNGSSYYDLKDFAVKDTSQIIKFKILRTLPSIRKVVSFLVIFIYQEGGVNFWFWISENCRIIRNEDHSVLLYFYDCNNSIKIFSRNFGDVNISKLNKIKCKKFDVKLNKNF